MRWLPITPKLTTCDTNLSEFLRNTVASIYKCIRQNKKILQKKNVKRYLQRFQNKFD